MSVADDDLQRLLDGEVDAADAAALHAALAPDARAQLAAYARLGDAIREGVGRGLGAAALTAAESEALFGRIAASLAAAGPGSEAPADAAPAVAEQAAGPSSPEVPRLRAVDGGRRGAPRGRTGRAGLVVAGLAAAAAVGLAVVRGAFERGGPAAPAAPGTEVVAVDFGANTGTVFEVEGARGEKLAVVVWIDDPAGGPGGGG